MIKVICDICGKEVFDEPIVKFTAQLRLVNSDNIQNLDGVQFNDIQDMHLHNDCLPTLIITIDRIRSSE